MEVSIINDSLDIVQFLSYTMSDFSELALDIVPSMLFHELLHRVVDVVLGVIFCVLL